ncbi:A/G-specific adenine DNA glycosylase [Paragonimus heterotremus]|uniref:A/G-specific adenine DNA glycosylase n=1 Tax=Paragonimus heterotremus TaxID=100268 RepID=A0A8J4T269_9TREM|nr:A/G-specific adenine DNA glycosylase [Paragonimus heterotremus]
MKMEGRVYTWSSLLLRCRRQRHHFSHEEIERVRQKLLRWYDQHKRDLPWRRMLSQSDPNIRTYAVWVSEVMLQQTQVKTVTVYYDRWMKKWPTVDALAAASLEVPVVAEFNGELPRTADLLKLRIPGVGRYTAGAIASIACNELVPVLDGKVIRVLTRLLQIGSPVQASSTTTLLWDLAAKLVDVERPGDFNQAMMELGAVCCTPKQPDCSHCPLGMSGLCGALEVSKVNNVKQRSNALRTECLKDSFLGDIEECTTCIARGTFDSSLGVMNYPVKLSKRQARIETTAVIIAFSDCADQHQFLLFQRPKTGEL